LPALLTGLLVSGLIQGKPLSPSPLRYFWRRRFPHNLRTQVALVIASLSFVPNLVFILSVPWILADRQLSSEGSALLLLWIPLLAVLSALAGYALSSMLLRPLTLLARELAHLETLINQPDRWTLLLRPGDPQEVLILRQALAHLLRQIQSNQRQREAFTATLVHDLKTPLIAFGHLLGALKQELPLSRQERLALLDRMLEENQRNLALVQKMVEVYRLERGEIVLHPRPCDLGSLARRVANRMGSLARERGIDLGVEGEGWGNADETELERALVNLVDNALRYARRAVVLTVGPRQIQVRDDGPGLPAPLEDLAQPYIAQTISIAGQHYPTGLGGLGLYIAKRILEAHGGDLRLVETGSQGTTLALVLP
jgi:signal transduction histidine kinase